MNRSTSANFAGCLSIAFSLAFWVWFGLLALLPERQSLALLRLGANSGGQVFWLLSWIVGLLLGLIATLQGSRRWIGAVILTTVSAATAIYLVWHMEKP